MRSAPCTGFPARRSRRSLCTYSPQGLEYGNKGGNTSRIGVGAKYMLGSRSAIDWIIDRYHIRTDKSSGITNDSDLTVTTPATSSSSSNEL